MGASPQRAIDPAVLVQRVSKRFPRKRPLGEVLRHPFAFRERTPALDAISFRIEPGELVGLLGPNGAGKTTLIKILCGLVLPDDGRAEVFGVPVGDLRLPRVLGLVHGEERSFYWRLTGRENLEFFARLHYLPRNVRRERVDDLLGRVNLTLDADRRFADYSSGMRQRLAIARALLADPRLVLMDEPTRSLDPVSAAEQRDWIKGELHARLGKTILIATHNLREAETICDRVLVIAKGTLRADGSPAELRRQGVGGIVYRIRAQGALPAELAPARVLERTPAGDGTVELTVQLEHESELDAVLLAVRSAGARIVGCGPDEADLEAVFRRLVLPAPEQVER